LHQLLKNSSGDDVVIIGRGKSIQHHPANIRDRKLIQAHLADYSNAETKGLKSKILRKVLNDVRNSSANSLGFVKRDTITGRWFAVNDNSARISIAQAFRDGLQSDYRSSKANKAQTRSNVTQVPDISFPVASNVSTVPAHSAHPLYVPHTEVQNELQQNMYMALNNPFETAMPRFFPQEDSSRKRARNSTSRKGESGSGHPPPFVVQQAEGTVSRIRIPFNTANGVSFDNKQDIGSLFMENASASILNHSTMVPTSTLRNRKETSDFMQSLEGMLLPTFPPKKISDPFEPTPLREGLPVRGATKTEKFLEIGASSFSDFPVALMTNTSDLEPSTNKKGNDESTLETIGHTPRSCQSEGISSLSLSSFELSDSEDTLGCINSLSSLSDHDAQHNNVATAAAGGNDGSGDRELQDAFEIFGQYESLEIEAALMSN